MSAKRKRKKPEPPPAIGSVYWLRFADVAYRLQRSVGRTYELRRNDPRFPKAFEPPGCEGRPVYLESQVAEYAALLATPEGIAESMRINAELAAGREQTA